MQNSNFVEADLDLLHKVWPSHPLIPRARRNPIRYANEVLYALLDKATREDIRLNRRQYEQTKELNDGDNNAGGSDTIPEGGDNKSDIANAGADNPSSDDGDDNIHVEDKSELEKQLEEVTQAHEESEQRVMEAEERVEELEADNEELQEQLEDAAQACEDAQAALEEKKKSPKPSKLKTVSSKKSPNTRTSNGKSSKTKTSK